MSLGPIKQVVGRAVPVPGDDIDTDRIIPARFLKCVVFDELGGQLFYDVRFDSEGKSIGHPIDKPRFVGASIIISGDNFGCGSSREHAPQAIKRAGFNAVIAGSYAEIFFGNCTTLGIVCVVADKAVRDALMKEVEANPAAEMVIDVDACKVTFNGKEYAAEIKPNARKAFLEGSYDSLAELLNGLPQVKDLEKTLKYSFV